MHASLPLILGRRGGRDIYRLRQRLRIHIALCVLDKVGKGDSVPPSQLRPLDKATQYPLASYVSRVTWKISPGVSVKCGWDEMRYTY